MTTYNTGNPVPSMDVRDLLDNAQSLDEGLNSGLDSFNDRRGVAHHTWARFDKMTTNALAQIGSTVTSAQTAVNGAKDAGIANINLSVAAVDTAEAAAKADMLQTAADLGDDLNNKRYATYAEMLADPQTRDAVVAVVDGDPDDAMNGWYSWDVSSSAWLRFFDQPVTTSGLSSLIETTEADDQGLIFEDDNGFVIGSLGAEKSLISGLKINLVTPDQTSINGLALSQSNNPGVEITDEHRFILARYDNAAPIAVGAGAAPSVLVDYRLDRQQRTQVMHVIGYGQSLGRGVNALPAISTAQAYSNVMLASGVKTREGESGYRPNALIPLVEQTSGSEGETPISGICNGAVRRAVADGESAADWVFLGSAAGQGGRAVEQLMPGTDPLSYFNKLERQIQDCKRLTDSLGKTYSVWAYSWDQGESNYENTAYTRSPYLYMQYMLSLFDTLTERVIAVTGQRFQPYILSYQVAAHRKYNRDNMSIALSQWRASRDREDFVLAVPVYIFPTGSDSLHLTNEASWLLGEYKSRAMYSTMIRRTGKWRPLEPVAVDWSAEHIDITFHVPSGPLVLDASLCALADNFGFDVREGDAVANIITGVTVMADHTVRIELSRAASQNAVVSYARGRSTDPSGSGPTQGARGNLRDSHGLFDTAVSPLGTTFALHNPCVMFQYDRQTGF